MSKRHLIFIFIAFFAFMAMAQIPVKTQAKKTLGFIAGRNVNMISGTEEITGDPFLQRQNEPSLAVSTVNPLHLLAAVNDYRTVDYAGTEGELSGEMPGTAQTQDKDAWIGILKSFDGGESWINELLPGYPLDSQGSSPLHNVYSTAADPVVRAGTDGMFYVSGIAFVRNIDKTLGKSVVFVSCYQDMNNSETEDSIEYLGTEIIEEREVPCFIDKPWLAVGIPQILGGEDSVYIAYTLFLKDSSGIIDSEIKFARSEGGSGWTEEPIILDSYSGDGIYIAAKKETRGIFQGAAMAVNPDDGSVQVAWRQFGNSKRQDAIKTIKIKDGDINNVGETVEVAIIDPFDQGTTTTEDYLAGMTGFRTNSYPSMAVDGTGKIYLAWSDRQGKTRSKIVVATSSDGVKWTHAKSVDSKGKGHQFMPSMTFGEGKLVVVWYDQREDASQQFDPYIYDSLGYFFHTVDVRAAFAEPGKNLKFDSSMQISRYMFVYDEDSSSIYQGQYNPPNFPLFMAGTAPFVGDYIDVCPSPMFKKDTDGFWIHNTEPTNSSPVFHVVWTDNRDVRLPVSPEYNWKLYAAPGTSDCIEGYNRGMRNQNVYTTRLSQGLEAGSLNNSKERLLTKDELVFIVQVNNTSDEIASYRLNISENTILAETEYASFSQYDMSADELDVSIAPHSSVTRPVYVKSILTDFDIRVDVTEIDAPGGMPIDGGFSDIIFLSVTGDSNEIAETFEPKIQLSGIVDWNESWGDWEKLNPNIFNPNIFNPNIFNPNIFNTDIVNPNIFNPNIFNPNIFNPNIFNPNIFNPNIFNPNIFNPNIFNPNIFNPNIFNPNIFNPNIFNPNIFNASLSGSEVFDVVWTVTNEGTATASYVFKAFAKDTLPEGIYAQLLIYRNHTSPITSLNPDDDECILGNQIHQELVANIVNPNIFNPNIFNTGILSPNIFNASIENATFSVEPGDYVDVMLRLIDPTPTESKVMQNGGIFDIEDFANNVGGAVTAQTPNTGEEEVSADATDLIIGTVSLPSGTINSEYNAYILAVGGDPNNPIYQWSLNSGTLPPPLDIVTAGDGRGLISGTPTATGTFYFIVQVDDLSSGTSDTQEYHITIYSGPVPDEPSILTTSLPNGVVGNYYGGTLDASGGQLPYQWTLSSGLLPDGLSLDEGGIITGRPTVEGTFNFTVQVTDMDGDFDTQLFSITVLASAGTEIVISGMVYDSGGFPLNGVVLRGLPNTPITGSGSWIPGYYADIVPSGWEGIAEPFIVDSSFTPQTRTYVSSVTTSDIPNQDYNETQPSMLTISGTVNTGAGSGSGMMTIESLEGVLMDGFPGSPVLTGPAGVYTAEVPYDWTGTITPLKTGYIFEPIFERYENIVSNQVAQNYEGVEGWVAFYDGGMTESKSDMALTLATDLSGNVYISGFSDGEPLFDEMNAVTIKYNGSDGAEVWVTRSPNWQDIPQDMAVFRNASGNDFAYVTGQGNNTSRFVTLKYAGLDGNAEWGGGIFYDNEGIGQEHGANDIFVDSWGDVYVIGSVDDDDASDVYKFRYAVIKYDGVTSAQLWVSKFGNGPSDYPLDIVVDALGNVYVTGSSSNGLDSDFLTVKFDRDGNYLWDIRLDSGQGDDGARVIAFDPAGFLFVAGYVSTASVGKDYAVMKYDLDGNEIWLSLVMAGGLSHLDDTPSDMAIDGSGNIYVTGRSATDGSGNFNFLTAKFEDNGNFGLDPWAVEYDGTGGQNDRAEAIAIDPFGFIYVAGGSIGSGGNYDFVTIKYKDDGAGYTEQWTRRFDAGYGGDQATDMALDTFGDIYVTGGSNGDGTGKDYATIKYKQLFTDIAFVSTAIQDGVAGSPYAVSFDVIGGTNPHTWTHTGGTLPAGLALESTTGILSGTPTTSGPFNFEITVSDGTYSTPQSFNLTINVGPFVQFSVEAEGGGNIGSQYVGIPFNIQVTAVDAGGDNAVTSFTGTVVITSTGALSSGGGATANFVNGVLVSHEVAISNDGNFTIIATNSSGPEIGTSNSFDITFATYYDLMVDIEPPGSGNVIFDPPGSPSPYPSGTIVELTATPEINYMFTEWSGDVPAGHENDNPLTITVDDYKNLTANFAIDQYTLTYTAGANGSITGTSPQTVDHGSDGTAVTAVPSTNYHFVQWSDSSTDNPRTDTNVTSDISVTAVFTAIMANQVSLTGPSKVGGGFVSEAFTLTSKDGGGTPANVAEDTVFDLSTDSTGLTTFYSNPEGTTPITQVTIPTSQNTATFYYMDDVKGTPTVTTTWVNGGSDLGSDTHQPTIWPVVGQIVYASDIDGNWEIYIMNADGTGNQRLTDNTVSDGDPSWSPNGSKIVFKTFRDGNWEIYTMNADGSWPVNLTNDSAQDSYPSWSPDGTKIAFCRDPGDLTSEIYVMNADGTGLIKLTDSSPALDKVPNWSPDGTQIVYQGFGETNDEIYIMNADGTGVPTRLTSNSSSDGSPSWSPDGGKIAYTSHGNHSGNLEIYVMNTDGTEQTRLTNSVGEDIDPFWSPDGSRIIFMSWRDTNWEIYSMDVDGSGQTRLTSTSADERRPRWGGSKVAFISNRTGDYEIYIMNANGIGQTRLTANSGIPFNEYLNWSPDGTKIAFVSESDGDMEIYVINSDGTGLNQLTTNTTIDKDPSWSPDGTKIVFSRWDGDYEIFYMNSSDGSGETQLTFNTASIMDVEPCWSLDGSKIAFVSSRDAGDIEIYVMNANGTNQTNLTDYPGFDSNPKWSLDGSKILFRSHRDGDGEIFIMNADGTDPTPLTFNSAYDFHPDWSPDGSKIVFTRLWGGGYNILIMDADGSNQTFLTDSADFDLFPSWRPKTRRIQ